MNLEYNCFKNEYSSEKSNINLFSDQNVVTSQVLMKNVITRARHFWEYNLMSFDQEIFPRTIQNGKNTIIWCFIIYMKHIWPFLWLIPSFLQRWVKLTHFAWNKLSKSLGFCTRSPWGSMPKKITAICNYFHNQIRDQNGQNRLNLMAWLVEIHLLWVKLTHLWKLVLKSPPNPVKRPRTPGL